MIDTLHLTKKLQNISEIDISDWNQKRLPNRHLKTASKYVPLDDIAGNKRLIHFSYDNFKQSLLISFSVPNLLYGSSLNEVNIENDYTRLKDILDSELTNYTDLEIDTFSISRLDICANVEYAYDIKKSLINHLYNSTSDKIEGKNKHVYDTTFEIFNESETLLLYDKIANDKEKGYVIPNEFEDKNILRFELQLRKKGSFKAKKRFGRYFLFPDLLNEKDKIKELLYTNIENLFNNSYSTSPYLLDISQYLKNNGKKNMNDLMLFLLLYNKILSYSSFELFTKTYCPRQSSRQLKKWKTMFNLLVNYKPQKHFQDILEKLSKKAGLKIDSQLKEL